MFESERVGGVFKEELSYNCFCVNIVIIYNINFEISEVSIILDYGSYLGIFCVFLGVK